MTMNISFSNQFFLFFIWLTIFSVQSFDPCSGKSDPQVLKHMCSKTPYRNAANMDDSLIEYPGCKPVKIFGLVRHGTRTPGTEVVNKVKRLVGRIKPSAHYPIPSDDCYPVTIFGTVKKNVPAKFSIFSYLSSYVSSPPPSKLYTIEEDNNLKSKTFEKWTTGLVSDPNKILMPEGEEELYGMGERIQHRFATLLPQKFSNTTYLFRTTNTQRTRESCKYFTQGLFGEEESENVWVSEPVRNHPIFEFHKYCEKWHKEVKKGKKSYEVPEKFMKSEVVYDALISVSNRLGLDYTLSFRTLRTIYGACAFEAAWTPEADPPWCKAFTMKDVQVIEYYEDLRYYYLHGYGHDVNYKQACPLLQNVMDFLLNDKEEKKASFFFTHSCAMLKCLSYLGLHKDMFALNDEIDPDLRDTRRWRVSKIDTFANNLFFVRFKCRDGDKLLTLHQEHKVALEGCGNVELCPMEIARKVIPSSMDQDCNFDKHCQVEMFKGINHNYKRDSDED